MHAGIFIQHEYPFPEALKAPDDDVEFFLHHLNVDLVLQEEHRMHVHLSFYEMYHHDKPSDARSSHAYANARIHPTQMHYAIA